MPGPTAQVPNHPTADDLLTTQQAAAILAISPGTLEGWRITRRYDLPFVRIGTRVRYRRGALTAFIADRTVQP